MTSRKSFDVSVVSTEILRDTNIYVGVRESTNEHRMPNELFVGLSYCVLQQVAWFLFFQILWQNCDNWNAFEGLDWQTIYFKNVQLLWFRSAALSCHSLEKDVFSKKFIIGDVWALLHCFIESPLELQVEHFTEFQHTIDVFLDDSLSTVKWTAKMSLISAATTEKGAQSGSEAH